MTNSHIRYVSSALPLLQLMIMMVVTCNKDRPRTDIDIEPIYARLKALLQQHNAKGGILIYN